VRLLLIRHAIAVPRGTTGIPDDDRPLTPKGEKRFRESARALAAIVKRPDALLTSPLPRAHRTAEIAAEAFGGPEPQRVRALAGGSIPELQKALEGYPEDALVALVGHEPYLSALLAYLVGGVPERLTFRKGGAALLDVGGALEDGATLLFYLPPRVLRTLAGD
jgi:phosphohistidine phosphatase